MSLLSTIGGIAQGLGGVASGIFGGSTVGTAVGGILQAAGQVASKVGTKATTMPAPKPQVPVVSWVDQPTLPAMQSAGSLPSWAIPAGIGLLALVLLKGK